MQSLCSEHKQAQPDSLHAKLTEMKLNPGYDPAELGTLRETKPLPPSITRTAGSLDNNENEHKKAQTIVQRFALLCPEFEAALSENFAQWFSSEATMEPDAIGNAAVKTGANVLDAFVSMRRKQEERLLHKASKTPHTSRSPTRYRELTRQRSVQTQPEVPDVNREAVTELDLSALDLRAHTAVDQLHRRKPRTWID